MLSKLAVPVLILGVAVFGCSSNDTPDDTAGRGGSTAAGGSSGGKGGSTAAGGSSAGGSSAGGSSAGGSSVGGSSVGGSSVGGSSVGGSSVGGSSVGGSSVAGRGGSTGAAGSSTGGSSAGGSSAGGSSAGGSSAGGSSAGGSSAGGSSAGGSSAGGSSAGGSGGGGVVAMASCTVMSNASGNTDMLSAADFCTNYLANCGTARAGYTNTETCVASYTAATTKHCRSYHLCWGVEGKGNGPADPVAHCPHAVGMGPCVEP